MVERQVDVDRGDRAAVARRRPSCCCARRRARSASACPSRRAGPGRRSPARRAPGGSAPSCRRSRRRPSTPSAVAAARASTESAVISPPKSTSPLGAARRGRALVGGRGGVGRDRRHHRPVGRIRVGAGRERRRRGRRGDPFRAGARRSGHDHADRDGPRGRRALARAGRPRSRRSRRPHRAPRQQPDRARGRPLRTTGTVCPAPGDGPRWRGRRVREATPWTRCTSSPPSPSARRSSSTWTARWRRSSTTRPTSRVPDSTRAELERLAARYALVACVSGRSGERAREIVGVDGLTYVGEHGLELDPEAEAWAPRIHAFAADAGWPAEDKPLSAAFHYRTAADQDAARRFLEGVETAARAEGFRTRWGRLVLEVLPPLETSKGTAVRRLLETHRLRARALRRRRHDRPRRLRGPRRPRRSRCGSRSSRAEGPSDLGARADVVVGSTEELARLLARL